MTSRWLWCWSLTLLFSVVLAWGCGGEKTAGPVNNDPVIMSVHAFPSWVAPSDSFAVFCSAYEPDGDSLFYDWSCTSGSVQGAPRHTPYQLFNTTENVRVFYAPDWSAVDSIRVFVHVRDGKGGGVSGWAFIGLSDEAGAVSEGIGEPGTGLARGGN